MAFTVASIEPAKATNLNARDIISAPNMDAVLQRDRFLFATRRRVLASLPKVVTTGAASYQVAYGPLVKTLPTATDTILIGVIADDDCNVRCNTSYGSAVITTGGPGCYIDAISGVPQDTWFGITVEVQSNTGSPVTIYGIYIAEAVLTASDLP